MTTDLATEIKEAKASGLAYFKCYRKIMPTQNFVATDSSLHSENDLKTFPNKDSEFVTSRCALR